MAIKDQLTRVIKVTRTQYERLLQHEVVTIDGQAITYSDQHVYVIKEEKGLQYEGL